MHEEFDTGPIGDEETPEPEAEDQFHYTYHVKLWAYFAHDLIRPVDYSEMFIDMSSPTPRLPRANDLGEYLATVDEEFVSAMVEDFGCSPDFITIIREIHPMF